MAKYYFFFPPETNLNYIQPVKAKNIHEAWEIMNFFFVKFCGYGYTIAQLVIDDMYHLEKFLPELNRKNVEEVLHERAGFI